MTDNYLRTLALAAAVSLATSGAVMAQTAAPGTAGTDTAAAQTDTAGGDDDGFDLGWLGLIGLLGLGGLARRNDHRHVGTTTGTTTTGVR